MLGYKTMLKLIVCFTPCSYKQVGVDNMCILVHAVKRQSFELLLEERISNALVEVGPSITLASLSEILAFAVGSFIPMPACRVFSMFAGLQITFCIVILVFNFFFKLNLDIVCPFFCSFGCSIGLLSTNYSFCCVDCIRLSES